jgi:hypothetical protein
MGDVRSVHDNPKLKAEDRTEELVKRYENNI